MDCTHSNILASANGRRWTCAGCGEQFVPERAAYPIGLDIALVMGRPLEYWVGLEKHIRDLEGEKFALEQRLAACEG